MNNEGAIKFYEKHGFEIVEEKKNYYKRIEPADAYVLQKTFRQKTAPSENKSSWKLVLCLLHNHEIWNYNYMVFVCSLFVKLITLT